MKAQYFVLASILSIAVPVTALAQARDTRAPRGTTGSAVPRDARENSPAYRAGFERGMRGGEDDGRQNRQYDYQNKSDYRSGDAGWNRNYGDRDRYRVEFRLGFEFGYRDGYDRYRGNNRDYRDNRDGGWRPGAGGPPPWANGRGRGGYQRTDLAFRNGFTDGYDAGLRDGRDRRRFDPVGEGRYRDGDHGYNRNYGARDFYRIRYREGFREGYEHGYEDGRRYDARYDSRYNNRPWWWPF